MYHNNSQYFSQGTNFRSFLNHPSSTKIESVLNRMTYLYGGGPGPQKINPANYFCNASQCASVTIKSLENTGYAVFAYGHKGRAVDSSLLTSEWNGNHTDNTTCRRRYHLQHSLTQTELSPCHACTLYLHTSILLRETFQAIAANVDLNRYLSTVEYVVYAHNVV